MVAAMKHRAHKRAYELERVRQARAVQLYADGFDRLTKREKIFAYYLSRAAIAGRTIAIDQTNKFALRIMRLCECIISHPKGIPARILKSIVEYLKLFWINNGMYDHATNRKFIPSCSEKEFGRALSAAAKHMSADENEYCHRLFDEVKRAMFDPEYLNVVTDKTPGHDFVAGSANNFYEGLTAAEIDDWSRSGQEKHPLNSKAVRRNGTIEEQVWKCGDEGHSPGMYADELRAIVDELELAKGYSTNDGQSRAVDLLIKFLRTGESSDWENFNIEWLKVNSNVDFILGFIELYMDARGQKGRFESVVYFTDRELTSLMRKLAANAQYFEDRAPWNDVYRKRDIIAPIANVVNVVMETGDAGPISAIGINLPNEQSIRQKYGSKSILLHNVVAAYTASEPKGLLEEFCFDASEVRRAKKYSRIADDLHTAMHEVLGHASGKVNPDLRGDPADHLPGYYSTLEEARADLVALWNAFDPKLKKLGLIDSDEVGRAMYDSYVRNAFLQLRRIPTGDQLEEDHMKNRQMVVNYVLQNSNAVQTASVRGKTFFHIKNYFEMRECVGALLAEVMRIKGEGDLKAGKELVDRYGLKINKKYRDEVLRRIRKLNLAAYTGFVMPRLVPVTNKSGKILDVKIDYPLSLTNQMLDFSKTPR